MHLLGLLRDSGLDSFLASSLSAYVQAAEQLHEGDATAVLPNNLIRIHFGNLGRVHPMISCAGVVACVKDLPHTGPTLLRTSCHPQTYFSWLGHD